ncbi:MAG TPA: TetR/AcrR family transcriptional regulator [Frankiaceae bacterium]|jgi:AcrR family transcriptional regulator|nr:transcriptional regulator, TetR family [Mycobacterium sp.]
MSQVRGDARVARTPRTAGGAASGRDPDRRQALLEAADRVLRASGGAASVAAISAEAGVSKPVLYRHFGDKAGLFRALAERHIERLLVSMRLAMRSPGTLVDRTAATIDAYVQLIEAEPALYTFLTRTAAAEEPSVSGEVSQFVQRLGAEITRGLGDLGKGDGAAWGPALVGMVRGAGDWWVDQPLATRPSRAQLVGALLTLLDGTLAAQATGRAGAPGTTRAETD